MEQEMKRKIRVSALIVRGIILLLTLGVAVLAVSIIAYILERGLPCVDWQFLTSEPDILNDSYGIKPMIINTIYTVVLTLIICIPLGVGSAIYLAEYAKQGKVVTVIRFAIEILSGIPYTHADRSANDDPDYGRITSHRRRRIQGGGNRHGRVQILHDPHDHTAMCAVGNRSRDHSQHRTDGQ